MLSTPVRVNTGENIRRIPGAPARPLRPASVAAEMNIGVPVARQLVFEEEVPATPAPAAARPAPAAPDRVRPFQLMQLNLDNNTVNRNLDDLFANADWALSWSAWERGYDEPVPLQLKKLTP